MKNWSNHIKSFMKKFSPEEFVSFKDKFLKELISDSKVLNEPSANLERSKDFEKHRFDPFWKEFYSRDMHGHKQILFSCLLKMEENNSVYDLKYIENILIKTIKSSGYTKEEVTSFLLQFLNQP